MTEVEQEAEAMLLGSTHFPHHLESFTEASSGT